MHLRLHLLRQIGVFSPSMRLAKLDSLRTSTARAEPTKSLRKPPETIIPQGADVAALARSQGTPSAYETLLLAHFMGLGLRRA